MKRTILCVAMAMIVASGSLFAQDTSGTPTEESVLQKARDKLNGTTGTQTTEPTPAPATETNSTTVTQTDGTTVTVTVTTTTEDKAPEEASSAEAEAEYSYTPAVIAFVPGLSYPFGIHDTSLSLAAIGALDAKILGIQAAGVFASSLDDVVGMQASGVFNTVAKNMSGFQSAGVFNIVDGDMHGIQSAGVFNIVEGSADWLQTAGVANIVGGTMRGLQAAGVYNSSNSFNGMMASGVVNVTGKGKGMMVGLVNVADSLDGIAIGLVNIIKDGVWDISTDYQFDSKTLYATYRSGTPMLYAVAYAGQQTEKLFTTGETITAGAGLGHRFKLLFLTVDTELSFETTTIEAFYSASHEVGYTSEMYTLMDDSINGFGSLRFSFGFGKRKGFGVYLGMKADFGDSGMFSVPDRFRKTFGSYQPEGTAIFNRVLPIWPKWFIGIKY